MALNIWSWLTDQAAILSYGYIGIFGLSFAMSLIVFVPMPYFIPLALASVILDPNIVSFSSAVGATLAKTLIFRAAYIGHRFIGEETHKRIRPFERLVWRYGWVAAFVAAVTPIPDDVIYIPLGYIKYSFWRFVVATFIGKFIFTLFIAWGARLSITYVYLFVEGIADIRIAVGVTAILAGIVIAMVYTILRLDWGRILGRWFPWTLERMKDEEP